MHSWSVSELEAREMIPGCEVRFVHGERMTVAYWTFAAGAPLRAHSHPHEQISNIITGEFEFTVAGDVKRVGPGSVIVIPPNAVHSGRALTACEIIDVFAPVREDYR